MPLLENGAWVPIILIDLDPQQNESWQAYLYEMWECGKMPVVKEQYDFILNIILLVIYTFTSLVGILALPTTWRFSKRRNASGYMILFHTVNISLLNSTVIF